MTLKGVLSWKASARAPLGLSPQKEIRNSSALIFQPNGHLLESSVSTTPKYKYKYKTQLFTICDNHCDCSRKFNTSCKTVLECGQGKIYSISESEDAVWMCFAAGGFRMEARVKLFITRPFLLQLDYHYQPCVTSCTVTSVNSALFTLFTLHRTLSTQFPSATTLDEDCSTKSLMKP